MERAGRLVVFSIDGQRFGIDVSVVERVVPAVAVTPLPGLPNHLLGLISVKGSDVPVLDMRRLLSLPQRGVAARDKMIIARGKLHAVALVIDEIAGVVDASGRTAQQNDSSSKASEAPEASAIIDGALDDRDGMILLCNENRLLTCGEAPALDAIHAGG